jgi:hypothetical protein
MINAMRERLLERLKVLEIERNKSVAQLNVIVGHINEIQFQIKDLDRLDQSRPSSRKLDLVPSSTDPMHGIPR